MDERMDELTLDNLSQIGQPDHKDEVADLSIVMYSAEWCAPCKTMMPIIDQLSYEFADFVEWRKADVERLPNLTLTENVCSVPTFIAYREGKEVFRKFGTIDKSTFKALIEAALKEAGVL